MVRILRIVVFVAFSVSNVIGQTLEFDSLQKLPSAINSVGEEGLPLLAMDGSQLFFTRALYAGNAGGRFSGVDVW